MRIKNQIYLQRKENNSSVNHYLDSEYFINCLFREPQVEDTKIKQQREEYKKSPILILFIFIYERTQFNTNHTIDTQKIDKEVILKKNIFLLHVWKISKKEISFYKLCS